MLLVMMRIIKVCCFVKQAFVVKQDCILPLNALDRANSQLWKNSFSDGGFSPEDFIFP